MISLFAGRREVACSGSGLDAGYSLATTTAVRQRCSACGTFHVEPCKLHQQNAVSRRRFLFLGAAAGITLAVAPAVELVGPLTTEVMGPLGWSEYWYRPELYGRIITTGSEIAASRDQRAPFVTAITRELQSIAAGIERENQRRLRDQGRRALR